MLGSSAAAQGKCISLFRLRRPPRVLCLCTLLGGHAKIGQKNLSNNTNLCLCPDNTVNKSALEPSVPLCHTRFGYREGRIVCQMMIIDSDSGVFTSAPNVAAPILYVAVPGPFLWRVPR